MNYKIIIEKKEPNQNFEEDYKRWQDDARYFKNNYDITTPQREIITNALICELTEEQFKAIKAEVFKVFE